VEVRWQLLRILFAVARLGVTLWLTAYGHSSAPIEGSVKEILGRKNVMLQEMVWGVEVDGL
jgi:hypothetical protein